MTKGGGGAGDGAAQLQKAQANQTNKATKAKLQEIRANGTIIRTKKNNENNKTNK